MLFKIVHLKGIKEGRISLAFRKWKKPMVKKGSLIKTAVGQLQILDIIEIEKSSITAEESLKSGYQNKSELISILDSKKVGNIFKINVKYHSADPRIELRNQTNLSQNEINLIIKKLQKMDSTSKKGSWTYEILNAIFENPDTRAQDLSDKLGFEKDWLKPNIRKLKNMGLTISQMVGYQISPRGKVILQNLQK